MRLCLMKCEEKIEDVYMCEDRYVCAYVRKRTFDWLENWLHFNISSLEKTDSACGLCTGVCIRVRVQTNIWLPWWLETFEFRWLHFFESMYFLLGGLCIHCQRAYRGVWLHGICQSGGDQFLSTRIQASSASGTRKLFYPTLTWKTAAFVTCWALKKWGNARPCSKSRKKWGNVL